MATENVWLLEPMKPLAMARQVEPSLRRGMHDRFVRERELLKGIFPRGRFRMAEDGRCVLRPRWAALADAYLFWDGKSVGLFWNARRDLLQDATKGFPQSRPAMDCGDEGIWYFPPVSGLAKALPWFSRSNSKGRTPEELARIRPARTSLREPPASGSPSQPPLPPSPGSISPPPVIDEL